MYNAFINNRNKEELHKTIIPLIAMIEWTYFLAFLGYWYRTKPFVELNPMLLALIVVIFLQIGNRILYLRGKKYCRIIEYYSKIKISKTFSIVFSSSFAVLSVATLIFIGIIMQ